MEKLKSQVNVTFWFSGQSDILVLADVPPPPGMEKLKSQVNVTFWFSGQSDILVLADVPPFPVPLSDSMPEQETGEFQFQMDIWTWTPSTIPLQPKK